MSVTIASKPLGKKAYGSIGHLPNSRLGTGDHSVSPGQARICCEKARDRHDEIVVQEKLDGSCVAVAKIDGILYPLGRAGWPAATSPYEQHQLFHIWVMENADRFQDALRDGERIVGEWCAQAHGTIYRLEHREPFFAFDIMEGDKRISWEAMMMRGHTFQMPHLLHRGGPISTEKVMEIHEKFHYPCDGIEGVVYRVHRKGQIDFLAKYVRADKIDGKHLPEISGQPPVWHWRPKSACKPG